MGCMIFVSLIMWVTAKLGTTNQPFLYPWYKARNYELQYTSFLFATAFSLAAQSKYLSSIYHTINWCVLYCCLKMTTCMDYCMHVNVKLALWEMTFYFQYFIFVRSWRQSGGHLVDSWNFAINYHHLSWIYYKHIHIFIIV